MRNAKYVSKSRRRAFTLFEVLMVIVILGVLMAILIPQFTGAGDKAKVDATNILVNATITNQLDLFKAHCGRYPTTDEGLKALIEKPSDEDIAKNWGGPYTKPSDFKDAWGNDLIYQSPGNNNEKGFDLSSPGPDRQAGNEDDICNWKRV